jgi:hypothetical protein
MPSGQRLGVFRVGVDMNNGTKVLIGSVLVGTVSDVLFKDSIVRGNPNGLSVLIWSAAVSVVVSVFLFKTGFMRQAFRWLIPFNLACLSYMWRDSPVLHFIDMIVIFVSLTALSWAARGFDIESAGFVDYFAGGFSMLVDSLVEACPFIKQVYNWKDSVPLPVRLALPAIGRGFAYALPLLLLFGSLFWTADPAFAKLVSKSMSFNFSDFSTHLIILGGFAWLTAGYLMPITATNGARNFNVHVLNPPKVSRLELNVVLACLNALFLSFVIVQFRYFFHDGGLVAGLSYAEYARRGFFELTAVSALVLPLLLLLHWFTPRLHDKWDRVFPAQAALQIALLFVIMLSATQRMAMYQDEFGLTELRFYTSAFIGWLGVVYLIFGGTVLCGKRKLFAYLATLSGIFAAGVVQLSNPDNIIMAVNIDRAEHGKAFDLAYALALSSDAGDYLVKNLHRLPAATQSKIATALMNRHATKIAYDARSFNVARLQADDAVNSRLTILSQLAAKPIASPERLIAPAPGRN